MEFVWGDLQKQPIGAKLECFLTSDYSQLATAIRPFRAIHHLREAKILNVTTRSFKDYADQMKAKFGTEMKQIDLDTVVKAYNADRRQGRGGGDRAVDEGGRGADRAVARRTSSSRASSPWPSRTCWPRRTRRS